MGYPRYIARHQKKKKSELPSAPGRGAGKRPPPGANQQSDGAHSATMPQIIYDSSVLRLLTHTTSPHAHLRPRVLEWLHRKGIAQGLTLLPTPLLLLEYAGYRTMALYPKHQAVPPVDSHADAKQRINCWLAAARAYFDGHVALQPDALAMRIDGEQPYLLDDEVARRIFSDLRATLLSAGYRKLLVETLAWDFLQGRVDFGEPPPEWQPPNAFLAALAPRRGFLAACEHALVRNILTTRRAGIPISPIRRLGSVAQLLLAQQTWVQRDDAKVPLAQEVAFRGYDNGGDTEVLGFVLAGWQGKRVTGFTADRLIESDVRMQVYHSLLTDFLAAFGDNEPDLAASCTPGKLYVLKGDHALFTKVVPGEPTNEFHDAVGFP